VVKDVDVSKGGGFRRGRALVTWDPTTVVRYSLDGHEHSTTVLHFGQTLGSGDRSDALLQGFRFPAEKSVMVSVRPGDPATAVLDPGLHPDAFWLVGAGLAFLLPALLCLFVLPAMAGLARPSGADDAFAAHVHESIDRAWRGERVDVDDAPPPPVRDAGAAFGVMGGGAAHAGGGGLLGRGER
jgi:hypothetical protein